MGVYWGVIADCAGRVSDTPQFRWIPILKICCHMTIPARVFHDEVKQRFGLHDMIVVGVVNNSEQGVFNRESLSELKQLSDSIVQMEVLSVRI